MSLAPQGRQPATRQPGREPTLPMTDDAARLMARLLQLERRLQYRHPARPGESAIATIEGDYPVLLSAPHSCAHHRSGMMKVEEEFTAAIVMYLASSIGCSGIFLRRCCPDDPNWQPECEYKDRLAALAERCGAAFVIDLHGMINRHHCGLALGTMKGQSCPGVNVARPFVEAGFEVCQFPLDELAAAPTWRRLVVDHPRFTGGLRSHTVTRFAVEALALLALQVEVASVARVVYSAPDEGWPHAYCGDPRAIAATVQGLANLVLTLGRA